ncbi:MAG: DUF3237 family protein [Steroidobacteraceae bacterium]
MNRGRGSDSARPGVRIPHRAAVRSWAAAAIRAGASRRSTRLCGRQRREITGPRLQGRVLPQSGGDWPMFWPGGLVDFEAHYQLEAADGTPIYIHNRGIAWSSAEVLARLEAGQGVAPHETYCRITPRFEVPDGPHEWLGRTLFVGTGERRGAHSVFDYYAVS